MKKHILDFKIRLEKELCAMMEKPLSWDSAYKASKMAKCWLRLDEMCEKLAAYAPYADHTSTYGSDKKKLTHQELMDWVNSMQNVDGSHGPHWTIDQTTSVANSIGVMFDHIDPLTWNVAMNMMYSDYYNVAVAHGVNTADFYAGMAKAFLFDPDGPGPCAAMYGKYHSKMGY